MIFYPHTEWGRLWQEFLWDSLLRRKEAYLQNEDFYPPHRGWSYFVAGISSTSEDGRVYISLALENPGFLRGIPAAWLALNPTLSIPEDVPLVVVNPENPGTECICT